jgi:antitoxin StbD
MESLRPILADKTISISEFKKNFMAVVKQTGGFLAVSNTNKLEFCCIPADAYADFLHKLKDTELGKIVI